MPATPVSPPRLPYLLLQFHHLGLSVVQGLVSDLNVSPLVLVGGARSSQFYFQFLLFPLRFLVYQNKVRVSSGQHSSLPSFQESFPPEVEERWGTSCWDFSQDRECKSVAMGKKKACGFEGREGLIALKNKHGTFK